MWRLATDGPQAPRSRLPSRIEQRMGSLERVTSLHIMMHAETRQAVVPSAKECSLGPTMQLAALLLLAQIAVPPRRGYVNDFAAALDPASVAHMTAVIVEVRAKTRGEVAVVTLPDLGGRAASDVALQIGRQWGVGARGAAGDPAKNLGVVVLLVPRKNHRPGTGDIFIATGRGAEGFLPDARVGRIRDAMLPALATEDYGPALALGVDLIAQAFAAEFGVTLTGPAVDPVGRALRERPGVRIPIGW